MVMIRILFLSLISFPLHLLSAGPSNLLLYGGGNVQVNSEINTQYQTLTAGTPITGNIMITHDSNESIDSNSFRLGDKPLKTTFVQSTPISSFSNLVVTIYSFQITEEKRGIYTLPPIKVKVGGKEYQALPMTIQVE